MKLQTGDFLGDLFGSNLSVESIKQYANQLKEENKVPFIHFAEEGLEDELKILWKDLPDDELEDESISSIYEELEYPLNRGLIFYDSQFEINYSHKTWVIFTQDGIIMKDPTPPSLEYVLFRWDSWGEVLYTKHAKLDAPVILLANPTQPGVPEISISPVLDLKTNVKMWQEEDEKGLNVIKSGYDDLTLEKMNYAYQILNRFYVEIVDKNRDSDSNEMPLELLSFLYKKDFKILLDIKNEEVQKKIKYTDRIINKLEKLKKDEELNVIIIPGNGIYEELGVDGSYIIGTGDDKDCYVDCVMEWNTGEFEKVMLVSDLINLLKENTLDEMDQDTFYDAELNETQDGNLRLNELLWKEDGDFKKGIEVVLDEGEDEDDVMNEIYKNGYIDDSEYNYKGIDSLKIESEKLDFSETISRRYWKDELISGKEKLKDKNYHGAIKDLNVFIEFDSDNKEAFLNRANAKKELEDYEGAIEDFSKVIEIDPNNATAYQQRGNAKSNLKDYQGALEDFSKAIELDSEWWVYYSIRGDVRKELKDNQGAFEDYDKVIELDPNRASAYYKRGNLKWELKDYEGVLEDFNKFIELEHGEAFGYQIRGNAKSELKDYQGALEDYSKAIEIDPKNEEAYQQRGNAKKSLEDYQGAVDDYSKAIEFDSDWWGYYSGRGDAKRNLKDYQGAIEDYNKVIELNPNHKRTYQNRGIAKGKLKDFVGAINDFSKVIEISPNIAEAYYNRADPKYDLEDYKGAIEDYNKAINLNPNYKIAYSARGITKSMIHNYQGAIDDLSKAIEIDPDYKWAYQNRGKAKSNLKDYKGAIEDFDKAIELDPNDKGLAEKRDKIKQLLEGEKIKVKKEENEISNKKSETVEDNNKEIEQNPTAFNYCDRGILKYEKKDYYSAIADLLKAIELDPNYAKAYMASGNVKKALNDVNGAIADYNKALELEPDNKKFIEKRDNLTGIKSSVEPKSDKGVSQKGNVVSFTDLDTWLEIAKNGQKENKELGIKAIKPAKISKKSEVVVREIFNRIKTTYADGDENLVFKFSATGGCTVTYNKKKVVGFGFWTKGRIDIIILRDYKRNYFRPVISGLDVMNIREEQIETKVPWSYNFFRIIDEPESIENKIDILIELIGDGINTVKNGKVLSLKKGEHPKLKPIFEGSFEI